ncbi:hypothetical protein [Shewanella gelidii]|uniref:DUF998 domain-containing protein n=1 Tax=Shewanella gelidii TaxID=1642821 RepID=A0A917JIF4_9GAMM|nr:hypothetical protein [Shewanella gelidii]MCL1096856.1 hypothetical protein [Shewanella gelidii]GGI70661.1 hypothetical protein GCM10009332_04960 [Shewanella gelidii]
MKSQHFDLHRLVVIMTLLSALVGEVGICIALGAEYLENGIQALYTRVDMLGDYVNSELAIVFNISMLAAGSCMLLAMYGLFLLKQGAYSSIVACLGFLVGFSTVLMGVFPINYTVLHKFISLAFLLSTMCLYGLCIIAKFNHQSLCALPMFILSIIGFTASIIVLSQYDWATLDVTPCQHVKEQVCWIAVSIGIQVQVIVFWCISLALHMNQNIINQQDYSEPHHDTHRR